MGLGRSWQDHLSGLRCCGQAWQQLACLPTTVGTALLPPLAQVGMFDGTVRVLSLDPDSTLKVLATQVRPFYAHGWCLR